MRTLRTSVGAATGNYRGTKGMPEMQEPVLEHAPSEAQNPQVTDGKLAQNACIDKSVTTKGLSTENGQVYCHYTMVVGKWGTNEILSMSEPVYSRVE